MTDFLSRIVEMKDSHETLRVLLKNTVGSKQRKGNPSDTMKTEGRGNESRMETKGMENVLTLIQEKLADELAAISAADGFQSKETVETGP